MEVKWVKSWPSSFPTRSFTVLDEPHPLPINSISSNSTCSLKNPEVGQAHNYLGKSSLIISSMTSPTLKFFNIIMILFSYSLIFKVKNCIYLVKSWVNKSNWWTEKWLSQSLVSTTLLKYNSKKTKHSMGKQQHTSLWSKVDE